MKHPWKDHSFIQQAASANGWSASSQRGGSFLIEGAEQGLAWKCTLEQSDSEGGPASTIDWVCPQLVITNEDVRAVLKIVEDAVRAKSPAPRRLPVPMLTVYYETPRTDIGELIGLVRRHGWKSLFVNPPEEPRFVIDDTARILDHSLHQRLAHWPDAYTSDGRLQPARLTIVRIEPTGFWVRSAQWWASAPALAHQIRLGIDLATRLLPHYRQG
ncbi:MAG: hypothetical protein JNK48_11780 [Bryobacterales bacterium]|nr:hypothetical protein [Bryobacterales bacterium]